MLFAKHKAYSSAFTPLFAITAGNMLCAAAVVYGYVEATDVCMAAPVRAMLKCGHQQMFKATVKRSWAKTWSVQRKSKDSQGR